MNRAENTILGAKTPDAYIEASLKSRLSPADKARLAKIWMRTTGYTAQDILKARNRHPFWKMKKMEGAAERTRKRLAEHDYSEGVEVVWTPALVGEFLGMNGKDETGHYKNKDWQIAEHFKTTIPSIQYMRRKLAKVGRMLGKYASRTKVIEYLCLAESVLAKGPEAVIDSATRAKKAALPAPSAATARKVTTQKATTQKPTVSLRPSDKPKRKTTETPKRKSAFGVKPASGRKPVERVVEKHEEWSTKSKGSLPHQPRGGTRVAASDEKLAVKKAGFVVKKERKSPVERKEKPKTPAPKKKIAAKPEGRSRPAKKDYSAPGSKYIKSASRPSTHSKKSRTTKK